MNRFDSSFQILNYINGQFKLPHSGQFFQNENPATGKNYSSVAASSRYDVDQAVHAAKAALPLWSGLSAKERSNYLMAFAEKIGERIDELAFAESVDSGKPLSLALTVDIPRSKKNFEFFANLILDWKNENFNSDESKNEIVHQPVGVVACISPWNLPLYLLTWKIAPALAAGNTVVAKPSEVTPMTAQMLCEIAHEINLPAGVLNIVHGFGGEVGTPLVKHPEVKAITFTGSTTTGRKIAEMTAGTFKKLSLEMGGKNANIIFADCDFELALATTLRSSFSNQGQICLCGSRVLIENSIYEKFKEKLVQKTKMLIQGDPLDLNTQQGAVVSKIHQDKILTMVESARINGAKILCGGRKLNRPGYFIEPTIIEGSDWNSEINQEEIFGPVITLIPFSSVEDALRIANSTKYGLSASLWTIDLKKARFVAMSLQTGIVWINTWMNRDLRTPFGGVKQSGVGREGGRYVLEFMSESKTICSLNET